LFLDQLRATQLRFQQLKKLSMMRINRMNSKEQRDLENTLPDEISRDDCKLELINISCIKAECELFSSIDAELQPGDNLQIEGINGSGKTTLLRIICGLTFPESGEIRWNGASIHKDRQSYNEDLVYVGHAHGIKPQLTPIENLKIEQEFSTMDDSMTIEEILDRVGLFQFRDHSCSTLSAGQCRRIALARLLMRRGRLWILDEPCSNLDHSGFDLVGELISSHLARGGISIFVSHQPIPISSHHARAIRL